MGITELAAKTELLPSDVHRILASLEPFGYVEQDVHTKKYHLGLEPLKLGHTVLTRLEVREIGRPLLRRLSNVNVRATAGLAKASTPAYSVSMGVISAVEWVPVESGLFSGGLSGQRTATLL